MTKFPIFLSSIFIASTRLFNLEIFIEKDAPNRNLLDFAREDHGTDQEFWGLGLHVIISRLRISPQ